MVGFNLALNLTLIWPLGAAGLAWSTAVTATCQVLILLWLVRRHVGAPIDGSVMVGWLRTVVLSSVMTVALAPLLMNFPAHKLNLVGCACLLAVMVVLGAGVVLAGARLIGDESVRYLFQAVRRMGRE